MRLFASVAAAAVLLTAAGTTAHALTAPVNIDTTGTTYVTDPVRVPMVFPVSGATSYSDTFLTCRSGCARKHMGQDLMGAKMTPLVAAFDGVISSLKREAAPGQGNYLVLNGDNGWSALYLHVNNDTPGTDDGRGTASYAFPKGIEVGTRVMAGQLVAWRGDSGNAESTGAHLHFELRKGSGWSGVVYNAFLSLRAATRLAVPGPSGPHPEQSLLKAASGPLLMTDGDLLHPVSAGVLAANGLSASSAVPATAAELRRYRTGPWLRLRDGALVSDPEGAVWRIAAGSRYPTTGQHVVPVAAVDVLPFPVIEAPTTPTVGMLVRYLGLTYVVDADGVLHLVDRYAMASWGWGAADAVDLPAPVLPVDPTVDPTADPSADPSGDLPATSEPPPGPVLGDPLGLRDGSLVSIAGVGPAVISGGVVRRIWDNRENAAYGYAGLPRLSVPAASVAALPTGELAGVSGWRSWRR